MLCNLRCLYKLIYASDERGWLHDKFGGSATLSEVVGKLMVSVRGDHPAAKSVSMVLEAPHESVWPLWLQADQ